MNTLSAKNSFSDLYEAYYLAQYMQNAVPAAKAYSSLKKNVMSKLEEMNLLTGFDTNNLLSSKQESISTLITSNIKHDLDQEVISFEKNASENIDEIKEVIDKKILNLIDSKDFKIDLQVGFSEFINGTDKSQTLKAQFVHLDAESSLGLYYILNGEIPKTEFFDKPYGFTLKLAEFEELNKLITHIRQKHKIRRPRNLSLTIKQKGRSETGKFKEKLSYVVNAENELYRMLENYMISNFDIPPNTSQGIPIISSDSNEAIFSLCEYNTHNKSLWNENVGVYTASSIKFKSNHVEDNLDFYSPNLTESVVTEIISRCVEKFTDYAVAKKFNVSFEKKY